MLCCKSFPVADLHAMLVHRAQADISPPLFRNSRPGTAIVVRLHAPSLLQGCMYRMEKPYTEYVGKVAAGKAQPEGPQVWQLLKATHTLLLT